MSFCVNCGTRLQEGMRFCPKCGTPAGGQAVPQNQAEQQEKPVQEFRQPQMSQAPRPNAGIKKPWQNAGAQGMRGNAPQQSGVNVVPPTGGMRTVDDLMNFFLGLGLSEKSVEKYRKVMETTVADLFPNEVIEFATDSVLGLGSKTSVSVFIAATNRRFMVVTKNNVLEAVRNGLQRRNGPNGVYSYDYRDILGIRSSKGLLTGNIIIDTGSDGRLDFAVDKKYTDSVYQNLRNSIYSHQ